MELTNIRLGDYIERSTINNKDLQYGTDLIVGVNSQGVFTVPKGNKDKIKAHAEQNGESVNGFINRAIDETMERDKKGTEGEQ